MDRTYRDGVKAGRAQMANRLLDVLSDKMRCSNDSDLAGFIGASTASLSQWRNGTVTPQATALSRMLEEVASSYVFPLAETEPVSPAKIRGGVGWRIERNADRRAAIREELEGRCGVYVFYDSMGRVTYVGQAKSNLFYEVEQRLKQQLRQTVYAREHGGAQLLAHQYLQGEVVRFLSAYETLTQSATQNIEALLIRANYNGLQNRKSAKFRVGDREV